MPREWSNERWGDWSFTYIVLGNEGLCLLDGVFRGHRVFRKLSLPVIRVKYNNDSCGPYNDRIHWDTDDWGEDMNPISGPHHLDKWPNGRYILTQEVLNEGVLWYEAAIYARIGAYHIIQRWRLNNDGVILATVFSKGLSCTVDHWHHPHWRFDFDLPGPTPQSVVVHTDNGIGRFQTEGFFRNADFSNPHYLIENPDTGLGVWIEPPQLDEVHGIVGPTDFQSFDGYLRLYRPEEDVPWEFHEETGMRFEKHELLNRGNVVFWLIGHLFHKASEGKHHLHGVSATLSVFIPSPRFAVTFPQPEEMAMRAFQHRALAATDQKMVGAFPNFYEATYNNFRVGGTIFVRAPEAEWRDISLVALHNLSLNDFRARFKATDVYAKSLGYVGGFPNFFHADYGSGVVCGTILIKKGGGEWRDVPLSQLQNVDLNDIEARFRVTQDYALDHGFVGGFPNFFHADHNDGRGIVCGTILLNPAVAQWQDVVLYKLPS